MVSKIAVIAIVAIVAVPILLGYAMNLREVTVEEYEKVGDPINVTPLLQSGIDYTYAHADILDINSKMKQGNTKVIPNYKTISPVRSSYQTFHINFFNTTYPSGNYDDLSIFTEFYEVFVYNPANGVMNIIVTYDDNGVTATRSFNNVYSIYYQAGTVNVKSYVNVGGWFVDESTVGVVNNARNINYSHTGSYSANVDRMYSSAGAGYYADISAGFFMNHFGIVGDPSVPDSYKNNNLTTLNLPTNPKNILLTMDLSTLSANFTIEAGAKRIQFVYSNDGLVHWEAYRFLTDNGGTRGSKICDLYYNNLRSSNTYQVYIDESGFDLRYVGNWPTLIGKANYYINYQYDWSDFSAGAVDIANLGVRGVGPQMRVDDSEYRAFEIPVITNETYDPSRFKYNPATTLENPALYGDSITFGGITYAVKDGKLIMGTHKIPINKITFESVPADENTFTNRINGTEISTTSAPSTITFNGKWSVSVSTSQMDLKTHTKTEWVAGSFGWNGVDHNFLMVGLLTCLGVFIALGIYARKTRSGGLIPLMIVTGCAATLFFIML